MSLFFRVSLIVDKPGKKKSYCIFWSYCVGESAIFCHIYTHSFAFTQWIKNLQYNIFVIQQSLFILKMHGRKPTASLAAVGFRRCFHKFTHFDTWYLNTVLPRFQRVFFIDKFPDFSHRSPGMEDLVVAYLVRYTGRNIHSFSLYRRRTHCVSGVNTDDTLLPFSTLVHLEKLSDLTNKVGFKLIW